jgi:hypothetical protein
MKKKTTERERGKYNLIIDFSSVVHYILKRDTTTYYYLPHELVSIFDRSVPISGV